MRPDVARDLTRSAKRFLDIVWPTMAPLCGGGAIMPVESSSSTDLKAAMDQLAGIDAWQLCKAEGRMRGLASRVQPSPFSYGTFTVRYTRTSGAETEYVKRKHTLELASEGWLWPWFTLQAYVHPHTHQLVAAAVVQTRELFWYIEEQLRLHPEDRDLRFDRNRQDGNVFLVIPWERLARTAQPVWSWPDGAKFAPPYQSILSTPYAPGEWEGLVVEPCEGRPGQPCSAATSTAVRRGA